jgi:hypothetical protein
MDQSPGWWKRDTHERFANILVPGIASCGGFFFLKSVKVPSHDGTTAGNSSGALACKELGLHEPEDMLATASPRPLSTSATSQMTDTVALHRGAIHLA